MTRELFAIVCSISMGINTLESLCPESITIEYSTTAVWDAMPVPYVASCIEKK